MGSGVATTSLRYLTNWRLSHSTGGVEEGGRLLGTPQALNGKIIEVTWLKPPGYAKRQMDLRKDRVLSGIKDRCWRLATLLFFKVPFAWFFWFFGKALITSSIVADPLANPPY